MNFNHNPANIYGTGATALSGSGYEDLGPVDEFGLPDLGTMSRKRAEMDPSSDYAYGRGVDYGYPYSAPSYGDGYDSGPPDFLYGAQEDRYSAEYYPATVNFRGSTPNDLVKPFMGCEHGFYYDEYVEQTPLPVQRAEKTFSKYKGPSRLKGGKLKPGPMRTPGGMPEGFATSGSRDTAPYPKAKSYAFNVKDVIKNPAKPVEYSLRNPRSKEHVFSNKHGNISVPDGISLTSGTTITVDSDYLVGNSGRGPDRQWGGPVSSFSQGAVGIGTNSIGNQYGASVLHRENNTFNGFTKNKTTRCLDSRNSVQGVYLGPADGTELDSINIGGPPPPVGLKVPSIFKSPNKSMDDYFTNIAYIKDNPQIVEFSGSNMFELMEDGTYGGHRPSTVSATAKRNIANEHYDDRIIDLRFGNEGTYQYALANGPGSTSRGVYLDMKAVSAMRPILDYIFYLETGGKILPDDTEDLYFVTEEQYFSTGPLDRDIVHYCSKRYNTGMIDVFKFLNYAFQYFFKRDPMSVSDFRTYSRHINNFIAEKYEN